MKPRTTVRGRGYSLARMQVAAYHRAKEDLDFSSAQIPLFSYCLIPNSISFSSTYSDYLFLYLIPITCAFTQVIGAQAFAREEKYYRLFFMFLKARTGQTHFDCKNTGDRD